jgi:hypothetical protein
VFVTQSHFQYTWATPNDTNGLDGKIRESDICSFFFLRSSRVKAYIDVLENPLGTIHYLHVKRDKLVWFKTKLQIARKSEIIGKFP